MPVDAPGGLQARFGDIMERHGVACSAEEFHSAVNVTFHEFESEDYDTGHRDMWESLPQQFNLLVDDWLKACPGAPSEIHLLDIGCGTGLASDCIMRTAVRDRIRSITLLDTAPAMLRRAAERVAALGVPHSSHLGTVESLPATPRYQLIVVCSVLHHVTDLAGFLATVRNLQAENGVFCHLQDPNEDYLSDPICRQRMAQIAEPLPEWIRRLGPGRILGRIFRELTGKQGTDLVSRTNRALLAKGTITSPLSVQDVYAVTDIHVHDDEGISISRMKAWMPGYECISQRSYGFFGRLGNRLPQPYARMEQDLIASRAPDGVHFGAIWALRPPSQSERDFAESRILDVQAAGPLPA